jgi:hypothetical protein
MARLSSTLLKALPDLAGSESGDALSDSFVGLIVLLAAHRVHAENAERPPYCPYG